LKSVTLHSITLDCFQGYGPTDNTIYLDNPGIIRLLGANGAGKSSVIVGLETCFFNNNYKNIPLASLANTKFNNGYKLTTNFFVDGVAYSVVNCREYKSRNNTNITITREDTGEDLSAHTITDTLKIIEDLLGVDYRTFNSLISISADNLNPILYGTDSEAREFLTKIFSLDKYDEFHRKVSDRLKEVSEELKAIEIEGAGKKSLYKSSTEQLESIEIQKIIPTKKLETKLDKLRKGTTDSISKVAVLEHDVDRITNKLRNEKSTAELLVEIKKLNKQAETLQKYSFSNKEDKKLQEITNEIGILDREQTSTKAAMNIGEEVCYTCKQSVNKKLLEKRSIEISRKLKNLLKEQSKLSESSKKVRLRVQGSLRLEECNSAIEEYSELEKCNSEINKLKKELGDSPQKIKELEKQLLEATVSNKERAQKIVTKKALESTIKTLNAELTELRYKYTALAEKIERLQKLKEIYSAKGIKSFKIEQILLEINGKLNQEDGILNSLSNGEFSARIIPIKSTNSGKILESISVIVSDSQKELPFVAFSEGEKKQVALALIFVIHELSPVSFNLLMLDEVTGNLTLEKREKLFEILKGSVNSGNKTVLLVSHDDLENEVLFTDVYRFEKLCGLCSIEENN